VDGNGFEDVAVAQLEGTDVHLLAADAAGLTGLFTLEFGGKTTSLLFPDLDGDGLCEAVATVFDQDSVQVHPGVAPFTWGEPVHYNVGLAPRAIGVLLLPGDATPDLLCANAHDLSLLYGLGGKHFRAARGYSTDLQSPIAVETADMDNDGDLDAVAISRRQEALIFLAGQGDGTLVTEKVLDLVPTADDDSGYMALADVDGDGRVDVLATVFERDELRLYRNPGEIGRFEDPTGTDVIPTGDGPLGLDLGDLDDDGLIDLLIGNVNAQSLQVLRGTGGGGFSAQPEVPLGFAPQAVLMADFDGDGWIDVAVSSNDDGQGGALVALLAGDGTGALELASTVALTGRPGVLAMGDVDEDGALDLVVGQPEVALQELPVLLNRGDFQFLRLDLEVSPGPGTPLVADVDQDGHLDVLVSTTDGDLGLLFGDGSGAFPGPRQVKGGELPCPDGTISASFGDLDGDRLPELLLVTPGAPFVWVAMNASVPMAGE
jgi:hypothetical protein